MSLLLNLILFLFWALVGILDPQLSNKDFNVKLITDFLTIEEQLLHLDATLSEFLHQIKLLVLVLAHSHVTEFLISLINIL